MIPEKKKVLIKILFLISLIIVSYIIGSLHGMMNTATNAVGHEELCNGTLEEEFDNGFCILNASQTNVTDCYELNNMKVIVDKGNWRDHVFNNIQSLLLTGKFSSKCDD